MTAIRAARRSSTCYTRPNRFYIVATPRRGRRPTRPRGSNPPCAFNPYTTCPIPVKDSILPVKVLAGEKAYPIHVTIPEPTK
jgi:hypothetical protein